MQGYSTAIGASTIGWNQVWCLCDVDSLPQISFWYFLKLIQQTSVEWHRHSLFWWTDMTESIADTNYSVIILKWSINVLASNNTLVALQGLISQRVYVLMMQILWKYLLLLHVNVVLGWHSGIGSYVMTLKVPAIPLDLTAILINPSGLSFGIYIKHIYCIF